MVSNYILPEKAGKVKSYGATQEFYGISQMLKPARPPLILMPVVISPVDHKNQRNPAPVSSVFAAKAELVSLTIQTLCTIRAVKDP